MCECSYKLALGQRFRLSVSVLNLEVNRRDETVRTHVPDFISSKYHMCVIITFNPSLYIDLMHCSHSFL